MSACSKSFVSRYSFWWSRKQFVVVFPAYTKCQRLERKTGEKVSMQSIFHLCSITNWSLLFVCFFAAAWINTFTEYVETWGLRVLSCLTLCKIKAGQDLKACIRWKFLEKKIKIKDWSFALNLSVTVILRPERRLGRCGLWGAASPVCGRVQQAIPKFYELSTPNYKLR